MERGAGFVKWVVAPALAALLGYKVIGPHYAGDPRLNKLVQKGKEVVESRAPKEPSNSVESSETPKPPSEETPRSEPTHDTTPSDAPAPRVSVDVKPVGGDAESEETPRPRRRRRRRHRTVEPSDEAPPETTAVPERTGPDPASTP